VAIQVKLTQYVKRDLTNSTDTWCRPCQPRDHILRWKIWTSVQRAEVSHVEARWTTARDPRADGFDSGQTASSFGVIVEFTRQRLPPADKCLPNDLGKTKVQKSKVSGTYQEPLISKMKGFGQTERHGDVVQVL